MRTAVVRIDVDPARELTPQRRTAGLGVVAAEPDAGLCPDPAAAVAGELRFQVRTADPHATVRTLVALCARAFGTAPVAGPVTFVSHGTDDDAHGILAGFGLAGEVVRTPDADGFDIVAVTLSAADPAAVPESRVLTALEAALNCEVRLRVR